MAHSLPPINDSDGAGDWTVAGFTTRYSPEQWNEIKAKLAKRSKGHFTRIHVADRADQHKPYGRMARLYDWWLSR